MILELMAYSVIAMVAVAFLLWLIIFMWGIFGTPPEVLKDIVAILILASFGVAIIGVFASLSLKRGG